MQTHYETLGVQTTASQQEIRNAYLRQIAKHHPDRNPSPKATQIAAQLNVAYEDLSDPEAREAYDRQLQERGQRGLAHSPLRTPPQRQRRSWMSTLIGVALLGCIAYLGVMLLTNLWGAVRPPFAPPSVPEAAPAKSPVMLKEPARPAKPATRPATGSSLQRPFDIDGHGQLKIRNVTGSDAVVYLVESASHRIARSFYLRVGESYTEKNIAPGAYRIAFVTGKDWDTSTGHFIREAYAGPSTSPLEFSEDSKGPGETVQPSYYEVRLRLAGSWIEDESRKAEQP